MPDVLLEDADPRSEAEVAALIDALAADPTRRDRLTDLLREDHAIYDQRGTAAIVRMRGWILLALARGDLSDAALVFVLEELETGSEAYLVAAAARALRAYPRPTPAFAPFVMRAIANIRYRDDPVSFEVYGDEAGASSAAVRTSPVRELLATLAWLGPHARGVLPDIEPLRAPRGGLSKKLFSDVDRAIDAIRPCARALAVADADRLGIAAPASDAIDPGARDADDCCSTLPDSLRSMFSWARGARRGCESIASIEFDDHSATRITFDHFFRGHPTIVVFFYTRCDNPLKCSLTITKLARIQQMLEERGLADRIRTAAITYDPAFDLPDRLRGYGQARGLRLGEHHRVLRATEGLDALRRHFNLGVGFIESLVNRHRIEVYVLDAQLRLAASFERLHWDEPQVVDRAIDLLTEDVTEDVTEGVTDATDGVTDEALTPTPSRSSVRPQSRQARRAATASPLLGTLASIGVAFFPKCPVCWAAYLSLIGVAGVERIPYAPWLQPVLVIGMLINLASVWRRGRATGRMSSLYLVAAGALAIVVSKMQGWDQAGTVGVILTLAGSLSSAVATATRTNASNASNASSTSRASSPSNAPNADAHSAFSVRTGSMRAARRAGM